MSELIIKYKNKKVLEVLKDLSKYFEFSIVLPNKEKEPKTFEINNVTVLKGDASIEETELNQIFSNKSIDSKKLREKLWDRSK